MNSLVPFSDTQAEALKAGFQLGSKALDTVTAAGGAIAPLTSDFVGWAFGDALKTRRWENCRRREHEAIERLRLRGIEPVDPGASVVLPIFEGACDEERPELAELWSKLLANALDPSRKGRVRQRFIEIVKKMDPLDALVFQVLLEFPNAQPSNRDFTATRLGVTADEVEVSLDNLFGFGLVAAHNVGHGERPQVLSAVLLTAVGRQFAAAIAA